MTAFLVSVLSHPLCRLCRATLDQHDFAAASSSCALIYVANDERRKAPPPIDMEVVLPARGS